MRPGEAVVRYHDGSSYRLQRVYTVAETARGIQVFQALPKRATAPGQLVHVIPGHNVDVVSWRERGRSDGPPHEHCGVCSEHTEDGHTHAWYERVWSWLVRG
jgi:hypothetical protein